MKKRSNYYPEYVNMYIIKLQFKFIPCFVFLSLVQMGAILLQDKGRREKGKVCLVEWSHEGPRWNYGKEQSRWGELKCNLMQHSNEIQAYEHTAVCMVDREDDEGKKDSGGKKRLVLVTSIGIGDYKPFLLVQMIMIIIMTCHLFQSNSSPFFKA